MQIIARRYDDGGIVAIDVAADGAATVQPLVNPPSVVDDLPWIAPGFFDLQVNGYGGHEFSSPQLTVEQVRRVADQLLAFGVTRFLPTVTTASFDVLQHALRTIVSAREDSTELARRIPGIHLEGPYLSPDDGPRGAHPLQYVRPPAGDEFSRLQQAAHGLIRLVTLSPEYPGAPEFIARLTGQGVVVAIGHTAATRQQISAAIDAGAKLSTHLGNGCHGTLPRHPNYLWDQLADDRLMASLILDGQHLPPEVVRTFLRAKTPARCACISDLSSLAGLPPGRYSSQLCETDILPDGRLVLAGQTQLLAGASEPIGTGIANAMNFAGLNVRTAVELATINPAKLIGTECGGNAIFQFAADRLQVERILLDGRCITPAPAAAQHAGT